MRAYRGERTDEGCRVTVDGVPLPVRSDLSGATAPFDWGYVGNRQLSLALLSHLLGDGQKAKVLCEVFEREIVARLPRNTWTVTDAEFIAALQALAGADATASADQSHSSSGGVVSVGVSCEGFGDMPVQTGSLVARREEARPACGDMPISTERDAASGDGLRP
jgi:hypothetical protein